MNFDQPYLRQHRFLQNFQHKWDLRYPRPDCWSECSVVPWSWFSSRIYLLLSCWQLWFLMLSGRSFVLDYQISCSAQPGPKCRKYKSKLIKKSIFTFLFVLVFEGWKFLWAGLSLGCYWTDCWVPMQTDANMILLSRVCF